MSDKKPEIKFDQSVLRCPDLLDKVPYIPKFIYKGFVPDRVEWEFIKKRSSFTESYKFRSKAIVQYCEESVQDINPGFKTEKENPYFLISGMREGEVLYVNLKLTAYESASSKKAWAYNEIMIIKGKPMNLPVLIKTVLNGRLTSSYIYEKDISDTMMEYNATRTWNNLSFIDLNPQIQNGAAQKIIQLKEYTKMGKNPRGLSYIEDPDTFNQDNIEYFDVDPVDIVGRDQSVQEFIAFSNQQRQISTFANMSNPNANVRISGLEEQYGLKRLERYDEGRSSHSAKGQTHKTNVTKQSMNKNKKLLDDTLGALSSIFGIYPLCNIVCNTLTKLVKTVPFSKEAPAPTSTSCYIAKVSGASKAYETKECCDDEDTCSDQAAE